MAISFEPIGLTERSRNLSLIASTNPNFDPTVYGYSERIGSGDWYLTMLDRLGTEKNEKLSAYNSFDTPANKFSALFELTATDDEIKSTVDDANEQGLVPWDEFVKNTDGSIKQIYNPNLKNEDGTTGGFEPVTEKIWITPRERLQRQIQGQKEIAKQELNLWTAQVVKDNLNPFVRVLNDTGAVLAKFGMGALDFLNNLVAFNFFWIGGIDAAIRGEVSNVGEFFTRGFQSEMLRPFQFCMGGTNDGFEEWLMHYTDFKNVDGTSTTAGDIILGAADTMGRALIPTLLTFGIGAAASAGGIAISKLTTDVITTTLFYSSYFAQGVKEMKDLQDKYDLKISDAGILAKQAIVTAGEVTIERLLDGVFGATALEGLMFGRATAGGLSGGIVKSSAPAFVKWATKGMLDAVHEATEEGLQEIFDGIVANCYNAANSQYKATGEFDWRAIGQAAGIGAITSVLGSATSLVKSNIGKYKSEYEVYAGTDNRVMRNNDGKIIEYVKDDKGNVVKDDAGNLKTQLAKDQNVATEIKTNKISKHQTITEEFELKEDGSRGNKIRRNEEGKILDKKGNVAEKQDVKTITKERKQSWFEVAMINAQLENVSERFAEVQKMLGDINLDELAEKVKNKRISLQEFRDTIAPYVDTVRLASVEAFVLANMYGTIGNENAQKLNKFYKALARAAEIKQSTIDTIDALKELKGSQKGKVTKILNAFKQSNNQTLQALSFILPQNYSLSKLLRLAERIEEAGVGGNSVVVDGETITDMRQLMASKRLISESDNARVKDIYNALGNSTAGVINKLTELGLPVDTTFVLTEEGSSPIIVETEKGNILIATSDFILNTNKAEITRIKIQQNLVENIIDGKVPGVDFSVLTSLYRLYNSKYCEGKDDSELATLVVTSFIFDPKLRDFMVLHGNKDFGNLYKYLNSEAAKSGERIADKYTKEIADALLTTYVNFCCNNPFVQVNLSFLNSEEQKTYKEQIDDARKAFKEMNVDDSTDDYQQIEALINTVSDKAHRDYLAALYANDKDNGNIRMYIATAILMTKRKEYMYNGDYRVEFTDGDIMLNKFLKTHNYTMKDIYDREGKIIKDIVEDFETEIKGYELKQNGPRDCSVIRTDIAYVTLSPVGKNVVPNANISYSYETDGERIVTGSTDYSLKEFVKKDANVDYSTASIDDIVHNPNILTDAVISDILKKSNKKEISDLDVSDIIGYFNEKFVSDNRLICKSLSNEYVVVDYSDFSSYKKDFYNNIDKLIFTEEFFNEVHDEYNAYKRSTNENDFRFSRKYDIEDLFGSSNRKFGPAKTVIIHINQTGAGYSGQAIGKEIHLYFSFANFDAIYFSKQLPIYAANFVTTEGQERAMRAYNQLFCTMCHEMTHIGQSYNLLYTGGSYTLIPMEMVKAYLKKYKNKSTYFYNSDIMKTRGSLYYFIAGEMYAFGNTSKPYLVANAIYFDGEYFYTPLGTFKAISPIVSKGSIKQQLIANNLLSKDGTKIVKNFNIITKYLADNPKDRYNPIDKTNTYAVNTNGNIETVISNYIAQPLLASGYRGEFTITIEYENDAHETKTTRLNLNFDMVNEYEQMSDIGYSKNDFMSSFSFKADTENNEGVEQTEQSAEEQPQKQQFDYRRKKVAKKRSSDIQKAKALETKTRKALTKTYTEEEVAQAKEKLQGLKNSRKLITEAKNLEKENEQITNKINELRDELDKTAKASRKDKISYNKKQELLSKLKELAKSIQDAEKDISKNKARIREIKETKITKDGKTTIGYYLRKPDALAAIKTTIRNQSIVAGEYEAEEDTERMRARALIKLTAKEKQSYKDWDDLGFGKKRDLSTKDVEGTNLEYWVNRKTRKGKTKKIQVDTKIQNFIVGVDLDKVDTRIADLIKAGKLTWFNILEIIGNNDIIPIDDYTFDAITAAIPEFRNPFIRSSEDLKWLVDNLPFIWAISVLKKDNKGVSAVTNINSLKKIVESYKDKKNSDNEKFSQIVNAFGLVKRDKVSIRNKDANKRMLRLYSGSIESAADLAYSLIQTAAAQEGKSSIHKVPYNRSGEITAKESLERKIGKDEDTEIGELIGDEEAVDAYSEVENTPMDEKRLFLVKQEAMAYKYSDKEVTNTTNAKILEKVEKLSNDEVNTLYAKFRLLEEQGVNTESLTIDGLRVTKEKKERNAQYVVNNIQKKWRSIKTALTQLSKPMLNRVIAENSDFIDSDGNLREDMLYTKVESNERKDIPYTKVYDKPISELEVIESKLTDLKHDLRSKLYEDVEKLEIVKKQRKELEKVKKALSIERARNAKANDFVPHQESTKIVDNGFKYTVTGNTEMPEVLRTILTTSFGKEVQTKIKNVSTDNDVHMQANYKEFFIANADTLANLTASDVDEIINFYTNITNDKFDSETTQTRYTWTKLVLFTYFAEEARKGRFNITDEQMNNMRAIMMSTTTQAAQILQLVGQIKFDFDPVTEITKKIISDGGLVVDAEDVKAVVEATDRLLLVSERLVGEENYQHELELAMTELQREYNALYEKAVKKNKQIGKRNIMERLQGLQRLCMLSGPGTMLRNATSNVILKFGNKLADAIGELFAKTSLGKKFVNKATDLSFQYRFNGEISENAKKMANSAFIEQLYTMISDGLLKQDTITLSKHGSLRSLSTMMADAIRTKVFHANEYNNKFVKTWSEIVQKGMSDDKFVKSSFKNYFAMFLTQRWGEVLASDKAFVTEDVDGKLEQVGSISQVIEEIMVDAYTQAANDYQHQPSFILKMEQSIKKYGGPAAYFAYKQIIPFASASWNWFKESLKWTPLGLAKSIRDIIKIESRINEMNAYSEKYRGGVVSGKFALANTLRNLSKGAIGTAFTLLGAILALTGLARIDKDDYDKLKLKVGDMYIDVSNLTGSSGLLFGMTLFSTDNKDNAFKHVLSAFSLMFDDMILNQVQSNLQNFKDDKWLSAIFANEYRMFYPAFLRDVAKVTNPFTPAYSSAWYRVFEKWLKDVPGLNYILSSQIDPYTGEKKLTYNTPVIIELVNRISPVKFASYITSDAQREAIRLGLRKGQISIDGLNSRQMQELNGIYGALNNTSLQNLFSNKVSYSLKDDKGNTKELRYSQMNDEQKKSVIERIMSNNASYAKVSYLTQNGYKYYTGDTEYEKLKKLGISQNVYRKTKKLEGYVKSN